MRDFAWTRKRKDVAQVSVRLELRVPKSSGRVVNRAKFVLDTEDDLGHSGVVAARAQTLIRSQATVKKLNAFCFGFA